MTDPYHPHNDADPAPTPDPAWVKEICRDLDTAHDGDVQMILDHCRYVLAMRDQQEGRR